MLQGAGRCRGGGTVYVFVTVYGLDGKELSSECCEGAVMSMSNYL